MEQLRNEIRPNYVNHQAFGTYLWISSTYWYHQTRFLKNRNGLNLAFFGGVSLVGSFMVASIFAPKVNWDKVNQLEADALH